MQQETRVQLLKSCLLAAEEVGHALHAVDAIGFMCRSNRCIAQCVLYKAW